jgi:hypothetical protein
LISVMQLSLEIEISLGTFTTFGFALWGRWLAVADAWAAEVLPKGATDINHAGDDLRRQLNSLQFWRWRRVEFHNMQNPFHWLLSRPVDTLRNSVKASTEVHFELLRTAITMLTLYTSEDSYQQLST